MSVYTELTQQDIENLLKDYALGHYESHQGISAGVENTNYFVTTDQHRLVLTLFEKHAPEELPFYLRLSEHLHANGCKVPQPFRDNGGHFLHIIKNKPAVFIERIPGQHIAQCDAHAQEIAKALAEVHLATAHFKESKPHSHNQQWIEHTIANVSTWLSDQDKALLASAWQQIKNIPSDLPRGIIHADLFHDNALFDQGAVTGIIDWYFAGEDHYALDIAIALNDWCLNKSNQFDTERGQSFLNAYESVRELDEYEQRALPLLQIQAATRFWLSRLIAAHQVQASDSITVKNPEEMKTLLLQLLSLYNKNSNFNS